MRGSKYCDKRAIIGPPAKRLYMTFHWRADRGPIFMLNWFANLTFPSQHANSANHRPLSETFACGSMMARVVSFQSHSIVSLVGRWWPDYVFNVLWILPSKHLKESHFRPASETQFRWRFAGGSIVTQHGCLVVTSFYSILGSTAVLDGEDSLYLEPSGIHVSQH